jgi:hypothetical protein
VIALGSSSSRRLSEKEVEPNTGAADTDSSGSLNDDSSEVNGNEIHIPEAIPNLTKPIMARPTVSRYLSAEPTVPRFYG